MKRFRVAAATGFGVGAAALATLSTGQAMADVGPSSYLPSPTLAAASAATPSGPNATSPFNGGYQGYKLYSGIPSLSATLTVPKFKCPVDARNLYGGAIFDTMGLPQAGAALTITCTGGVATYGLNAETLSDQDNEPGVSVGDKIVISDSETASNTVATATDLTSGATATAQDGVGDLSGNPPQSFNVGIFDDSGTTAKYKTITFNGVKANAIPLGLLRPRVQALDLMSGSDLQESTSSITGNNSAFTMTFLNAQ